MMSTIEVYEFENLVLEILSSPAFRLTIHSRRAAGADALAARDDERWVIEIKYYRTVRPQIHLLKAAAARVREALQDAPGATGLLIVSSVVEPNVAEELENELGIRIAGRDEVLAWATKVPGVLDRLVSILGMSGSVTSTRSNRAFDVLQKWNAVARPRTPPTTDGDRLCRELRGIKKGKGGWSAYEDVCERIIKYLFPNDLDGWQKQKRTDDGLNRFDYICRIKPSTEFWKFLIDDLRTRYVLFEFKNYTGKIKQPQILSTEKYLMEKALRKTAIIFSRKGAEKDAVAMSQGAMRDGGKLMLVLDDDRVCEMLHIRDRGDDPSDELFRMADDFLMRLGR